MTGKDKTKTDRPQAPRRFLPSGLTQVITAKLTGKLDDPWDGFLGYPGDKDGARLQAKAHFLSDLIVEVRAWRRRG
jgi:hypothetical protein